MSPRFLLRGLLALGAVISMAACAHTGAMLPSAPGSSSAAALPDIKLSDCKGQQNSKKYATLTVTLSTKGGSFCIPTFGGFGGSVQYPPANPSVKFMLTSSTTNYDNMPKLGSGTPLFYLQLAISGATSFGSNVKAGGGLTGKAIKPGQTYTAFGQATISGFTYNFTPCYAVATKGKYGGVIGGIGTLLKGQVVPSAASAVIEFYSGQQASQAC